MVLSSCRVKLMKSRLLTGTDDSYFAVKAIKAISGVKNKVTITSLDLAKYLDISQQSASELILRLLKDGLISRQIVGRKQEISITDKGMNVLLKEYVDLGTIFETQKSMKMTGDLITGMGEGRYYISRKFYVIQIKDKLGFMPYFGTLNLKILPEFSLALRKLRSMDGIHIEGFVTDDRTFGAVKAFRAKLKGIDCAVIFPERSIYTDVVEIISEVYLREKLKLKDHDLVEFEVTGPFI